MAPLRLAIQGTFLLVVGFGGARVARGAFGLDNLIAFLLYLLYVALPMAAIFQAIAEVQKGIACAQRVQEILDLPAEDAVDGRASARTPPRCRLELENVSFAYEPGRPVLEGVSLNDPGRAASRRRRAFRRREVHAPRAHGALLRGRRGDDPDWRDGHPVADAGEASFGYVEQETPVLAGTVGLNLLYAAPDADEGALDEAIEAALRNAIQRIGRDRTVVVLAPRLSTVTAADRIVVLERGRVRAAGTHAELLAGDELYRTSPRRSS